jgi:hypothetical protein
MVVKLLGETGRSLARMRTTAVVVSLLAGAVFYLYGPTLTPALHAAAVARCNDLAGANYRSYRLHWVVGTRPHWTCGNASKPQARPVDLGWTVLPSFF